MLVRGQTRKATGLRKMHIDVASSLSRREIIAFTAVGLVTIYAFVLAAGQTACLLELFSVECDSSALHNILAHDGCGK